MSGLGVVLLSLSLGDLVASGLSGEPIGPGRSIAGVTVTAFSAVVGAMALVSTTLQAISIVAAATVGAAAWIFSKGTARKDSLWARPRLALAVVGLTLLIAISLAGSWKLAVPHWFQAWVASLPFPLVGATGAGELLLLIGVLVFLSGPSNGIVRAVLTAAGTDWKRSEQTLRGGRVIGVLERWLIFALAFAGAPTAAALIVSAKSLLRFPELSRTRAEPEEERTMPAEVDVVTEYFLLGSLMSWTLALAPVWLF